MYFLRKSLIIRNFSTPLCIFVNITVTDERNIASKHVTGDK